MATPTVDFEIEGLKELAKNADKLRRSFTTSTLRTALRGAAKPVLRRAKATVPVDSGRLKRSLGIRAKVERNGSDSQMSKRGAAASIRATTRTSWSLALPSSRRSRFCAPRSTQRGGRARSTLAFVEAINKTIARQLARIAAK